MYLILWEFHTTHKARQAFVRAYAGNGDWARLFRRAPGHVATRLVPDPRNRLRFFTVDLWQSRSAFTNAKRRLAAQYATLDARCEKLTTKEKRLAAFSF